jgi:hypothetical protein
MLQSPEFIQSPEVIQSPGIIQLLQTILDKVKEQLMNVREYRAFLAIEKSIAEVSDLHDIVAPLESTKEKIKDRLKEVREYRAMLAVEKSIADISEVLGVLAGQPALAIVATATAMPEVTPVAISTEPTPAAPVIADKAEPAVVATTMPTLEAPIPEIATTQEELAQHGPPTAIVREPEVSSVTNT